METKQPFGDGTPIHDRNTYTGKRKLDEMQSTEHYLLNTITADRILNYIVLSFPVPPESPLAETEYSLEVPPIHHHLTHLKEGSTLLNLALTSKYLFAVYSKYIERELLFICHPTKQFKVYSPTRVSVYSIASVNHIPPNAKEVFLLNSEQEIFHPLPQLPSTVTHLSLSQISLSSFPPSLTYLSIHKFDPELSTVEFPASITHLALHFEESIPELQLPPSLVHLTVDVEKNYDESNYEEFIRRLKLPPSITYLKINLSENSTSCPPLPPHLEHLILKGGTIEWPILPDSLKTLAVVLEGVELEGDIPPLPPSLTAVSYITENQFPLPENLPPTLVSLKTGFGQTIEGPLPSTLRNLSISLDGDPSLPSFALSLITGLTVRNCDLPDLNQLPKLVYLVINGITVDTDTFLPPTLTHLTLINCESQVDINLPNLTDLAYYHGNHVNTTFPPNLHKLIMHQSSHSNIPPFPNSLKYFEKNTCDVDDDGTIPPYPPGLKYLFLDGYIEDIKLSPNLKYFSLQSMQSLPFHYPETLIWMHHDQNSNYGCPRDKVRKLAPEHCVFTGTMAVTCSQSKKDDEDDE